MVSLELRHIVKRYGRTIALNGIDLSIAAGEFFVIVGPSGCGKTTLLRVIAGLEHASEGSVWMDGVDVSSVPPRDRDVAMVFQNAVLYPHLTVAENLAFGLRARKTPEDEIRRRVCETGRLLGISHLFDRLPRHLSGGEKQRVALGRAVVRRPRVFLFDEPIGSLDVELQAHLRAEIRRMHRTVGATTVYVTHDQQEAMSLGDRICVMRAGAVQQVGTATDLYENPANQFVAGFFGIPPMNLVLAPVSGTAVVPVLVLNGVEVRPPAGWWGADAIPQEVVLGIRPEHVVIAESNADAVVQMVVDLCEMHGTDRLLHLSAASGKSLLLRARVPARQAHAPGCSVGVSFVWDRVVVFDPATGRRIR